MPVPSFGPNPINAQGALSRSMMEGQPLPTSPQSASFQPSLVVPQNPPMPNKSPITSMHLQSAMARRAGQQQPDAVPQNATPSASPNQITLPAQDQNPQQPGVQVPLSEAELIIKALSDRLKHHTKSEAHQTYASPEITQLTQSQGPQGGGGKEIPREVGQHVNQLGQKHDSQGNVSIPDTEHILEYAQKYLSIPKHIRSKMGSAELLAELRGANQRPRISVEKL